MKRQILSFIFLLSFFSGAHASGFFSFTIKPGSTSNTANIYFKANGAWTGKIGQITVVYGYQTSCATTAPTMSFSVSSQLNSLFGVGYTIVIPGTPETYDGYTYMATTMNLQIGSSNATLADQQEVLIGTVTFSNGMPSCDIYSPSFEDGGVTGADYDLINASITGSYGGSLDGAGDFSPVDGSGPYYSSAGNSTTGTSNAGNTLFASTTSPVSLPLTLLNFTAVPDGKDVLLQWKTAEEVQTSEFIIERSRDGNSYAQLGNPVPAAGNSSAALSYSAKDDDPFNGVNYYRLRMVNQDGSFQYSPVRTVQFSANGTINVYPTLNRTGIVYIQLPLDMEHAVISLTNVAGQQLGSRLSSTEGATRQVSLSGLAKGIYFINVTDKNTGTRQNFKVLFIQ